MSDTKYFWDRMEKLFTMLNTSVPEMGTPFWECATEVDTAIENLEKLKAEIENLKTGSTKFLLDQNLELREQRARLQEENEKLRETLNILLPHCAE